jgi:hypothetical protein
MPTRRTFLKLLASLGVLPLIPDHLCSAVGGSSPVAWLLAPMAQATYDGELYRYCALYDQQATISAAGGYWEYSEIDGNRAIARVRAPAAVLNSLSLLHKRLSDTEANAAWTPHRSKPFKDKDGQIKLRASQKSPTTPLETIASRVDGRIGSRELNSLVGLWLGLGFGLGWRLPYWLALALAVRIGEPNLFWKTILRAVFEQSGAFPTTSVLDNFNRTAEDPLSDGGNWTTAVLSTDAQLKTNGTLVQGSSATVNSSYRSNTTYGPNTESFFTLTTKSGSNIVGTYDRLVNPGSAGATDGYADQLGNIAATDEHRISRYDDSVPTQIANPAQEMSSGDAMGLESIGSTHAAYYKASGGSWTQLGTASDATYSAAGNIGLRVNNVNHTADDFGGGTVVAATRRPIPPIIF